jgi:hypothetical protein
MNAYNVAGPGNIAGDPAVFTLPTAYWPDVVFETVWKANACDGCAEVNVNGAVRLVSGTPSGSIPIDDIVTVSGTFTVP